MQRDWKVAGGWRKAEGRSQEVAGAAGRHRTRKRVLLATFPGSLLAPALEEMLVR